MGNFSHTKDMRENHVANSSGSHMNICEKFVLPKAGPKNASIPQFAMHEKRFGRPCVVAMLEIRCTGLYETLKMRFSQRAAEDSLEDMDSTNSFLWRAVNQSDT